MHDVLTSAEEAFLGAQIHMRSGWIVRHILSRLCGSALYNPGPICESQVFLWHLQSLSIAYTLQDHMC